MVQHASSCVLYHLYYNINNLYTLSQTTSAEDIYILHTQFTWMPEEYAQNFKAANLTAKFHVRELTPDTNKWNNL